MKKAYQASSIADNSAQPTAEPVQWELRELFWANHPSAPKDLPKAHFAWAVTGDDLYLSPIYDEKIARLIVAAPEVLAALEALVAACSVHPFPNLPVENPLILARAAIAKATKIA